LKFDHIHNKLLQVDLPCHLYQDTLGW